MLKHYEREKIIWDSELPGNEKFLLLAINSFVDSNGECWPGQELLARMCGIKDRTIRNLCKALETKGIIERNRRFDTRGFRTSDKFKVNFDAVKNPTGKPPQTLPEKSTTGKINHRKSTTVLPENDDSPTGNLRQTLPENISRDLSSKNYPEELSNDLDPPVVPQRDEPTSQTKNPEKSETAIAVDILPEDSEKQLGFLETEQPVIPDQPSEEANGSGQKRKGKSSGRAPAKEINKKDFERLRLVYNQFKPELWPECEKGNDKRMGYANRLYQDCDRNIAQCEAVLQVALEYAQTSPWWSGQDGRYTGGGFGTVFMKRRYQEFAEARAMQQRNKA